MNYKNIEKKALLISSIVNGINAFAGIFIYIITGLNALLLDSVFSVIGLVSSIAAIYISKNSHKKTDNFPRGLYFLEPLFGVLKSIATLMLLLIALLESGAVAYSYFTYGEGELIHTGPVLPYTILTGMLCFALSYYNYRKNKAINNLSTILHAESKANLVDGLISIGIGITVFLLNFISQDGHLGFFHYTGDFFITVILVLLSFKEPLTILIHSFKEFAYSTVQNEKLEEAIVYIVNHHLKKHQDDYDIFVHKQGMQINVRILILDLESHHIITQFALKKADLLNHLRKKFNQIHLEFVF
ncbi:cation transporter [Streptococcus uberis]|uniref:cation transporter n=1 Tax=Streptococcus uberis TaxID=1349 RepID=UPI0012B61C80|nr:cation transporter [Streptococcus uberis]MTB62023.1 cation transporter [Streptococcus uberis]MTB70279.1 cation transporter [Streptococcus uberis]MTB92098.1 cation transporter [Streptococcus uberis]MTC89524.1 cation transporter [Streptococcus uberis]